MWDNNKRRPLTMIQRTRGLIIVHHRPSNSSNGIAPSGGSLVDHWSRWSVSRFVNTRSKYQTNKKEKKSRNANYLIFWYTIYRLFWRKLVILSSWKFSVSIKRQRSFACPQGLDPFLRNIPFSRWNFEKFIRNSTMRFFFFPPCLLDIPIFSFLKSLRCMKIYHRNLFYSHLKDFFFFVRVNFVC